MTILSRRRLLHRAAAAVLSGGLLALGACRRRIIEIERVVQIPKEVTKIVTVVVSEAREDDSPVTVDTPAPPQPTATPPLGLIIDTIQGGWSDFEQHLASSFEDTFPHLTLDWRTSLPWPAYRRRIEALHAGGEGGDLLQVPIGPALARWTEAGLLQPLPAERSSVGLALEDLFRGPVTACQVEGRQMALPLVCHPGDALLLYRSRDFVDIEPPLPVNDWSLDDLVQASSDLGGGAYGLRYHMPSVLALFPLFGAHLFSADGSECALDGDAATGCLTWAHDIVHTWGAAPRPYEIEGGALTAFLNGEVSMIRASLGDSMILGDGDELRAALFPVQPETGARAGVASGIAYAIGARSEVAADAVHWLRFVTSQEMGVQMFLGGYAEPGPRPAAWRDSRVLEVAPVCASLAELLEGVPPIVNPAVLEPEPALRIWNRHIQKLLLGERSVLETREAICQEIDDYLAERRRPSRGTK